MSCTRYWQSLYLYFKLMEFRALYIFLNQPANCTRQHVVNLNIGEKKHVHFEGTAGSINVHNKKIDTPP